MERFLAGRRHFGGGLVHLPVCAEKLFALKREAASEEGNRAELKKLVHEEIITVQRLLNEAKKRIELGRAPVGEDLDLQRELLRLKRESLSL